jgi:hypothetical protein
MKFMRRLTEYNLQDRRRNENILELTVDPVEKEKAQYKQKRLNRFKRMGDIIYPKKLDCQLIGRRRRRKDVDDH